MRGPSHLSVLAPPGVPNVYNFTSSGKTQIIVLAPIPHPQILRKFQYKTLCRVLFVIYINSYYLWEVIKHY